uniref:Uncharacterized protein n=1 Tax=Solanum lycopersicum TaxID=4081 RepID=A0A3Q7IEW9_SOLLC
MSNMIAQLKSIGHIISDEQQVQAMSQYLPNNWEHLKVNLNHNESIKTFSDVVRHVELEDELLGVAEAACNAFVVQNLQASSVRKIGKRIGKTKRSEKHPQEKKRGQIPRKENGFFQEERLE